MSSQYDFDTIIDRHHTGAMKTDVLCERYGREDLIPLWIADMDFAVAPCITDALVRRLQHPVYGYAEAPASYWQSIIDWLDYLHGWKVKREWITYIPGIVKGIGLAVNVFSNPGDKIIIQTPVYTPFMAVPESNGRTALTTKWTSITLNRSSTPNASCSFSVILIIPEEWFGRWKHYSESPKSVHGTTYSSLPMKFMPICLSSEPNITLLPRYPKQRLKTVYRLELLPRRSTSQAWSAPMPLFPTKRFVSASSTGSRQTS